MTDLRTSTVCAPLVGRDAEVGRGQDALDRLLDGHGTVMVVSGEPGIGKTRLTEELAALAVDRGALVAWGRVDEVDGAPPYAPWADVLDAVLEAADRDVVAAALAANAGPIAAISDAVARVAGAFAPAAPLAPQAARFRLHEAIVDVLTRVSAQRPLVVVLEDVHWADVASLELMCFAAARLRAAAVLLIVTYRTIDGGASAAFDAALGALARQPSLERLTLAGLSELEVGRFMAQTIGLRPRTTAVALVHARTEGNPFFVGELARLLHGEGSLATAGASGGVDVPAGVRDVVRRRLAALPAATCELLVLGAVIGREFQIGVLAATADVDDVAVVDALEPALGAGLLGEIDGAIGRLRFSHAIIRDTIYGELSGLRRATLHARVGAAIQRRGAVQRSHLPELAWHFLHAASVVGPEPGISLALDAAREAQAAFAYEQAEDGLRSALRLVELIADEPLRMARELDVQNRLAGLLLLTRGQGAPEFGLACSRARELCAVIGENDELFKMLFGLTLFHVTHAEYRLLTELGAQLLAVGEQRDSTLWLLTGHLSIGSAQMHTGLLAGARESFASAERLARTLDLSTPETELLGEHPLALALPCVALVDWLISGDDERPLALHDEAVALARALGHPITLAEALYSANKLTVLRGDAERALAEADEALALCDEHALGMFQAWIRTHRGWALCQLGRCDEGIREMTAGIAADRAGGGLMNSAFFLALLADGELRRGDGDRALALVDEALAMTASSEDKLYDADLHRRRGELLAARGPTHAAEAWRSLRAAVTVAEAQGAVAFLRRAQEAISKLGPPPAKDGGPGDIAAAGLSPRERELLGLVGRGLTDKEIARDLVISLATVRSHLDRIRDKTGRRRRPELSRLADELGLTGP